MPRLFFVPLSASLPSFPIYQSFTLFFRRNCCFLMVPFGGLPFTNSSNICPKSLFSTPKVKRPFSELPYVQVRQISLGARRISAKAEKGLWAKYESKKRRKLPENISMKKQKGSKPTVNIFDGMSLRHLAVALDFEFDALCLQLLNFLPDSKMERILSDLNAPLDRFLVLQIVSFFDKKPILGVAPKCQIEQRRDLYPQAPPPQEELVPRPPVVTIMGHVDHGKTTLLDALRRSNIVAQEFGGITQHIGAFSVRLPDVRDNRTVTFLDTPGHAAFAEMRERGAHSTDIVVLVVAADDGVMDQTVESIRYAREAGVPIIVAINKCDKPGIDPQRIRHDLLQHEIVTENFGGDTFSVELSALYGRGIDKLQEAILMQSDFLELKSTPHGLSEATVIESSNAQGLGNHCTLIVNRGTLRKGSLLVSGVCWCRVKAMNDEFGMTMDTAGPGMPVQVAGWRNFLPPPGELALEVQSQQMAESVVAYRIAKKGEIETLRDTEETEGKRSEIRKRYEAARKEKLSHGKMQLSVSYQVQAELRNEERAKPKAHRFPLLLKCDVEGTLQAIKTVLDSYGAHDQVQLTIVATGVGTLKENEFELAIETNAQIFCFNTNVPQRLSLLAKDQNVPLHQFNVIYKLVDRLKELLTERIPIVNERRLVAEGTVLTEYRIPDGLKKKQPVAGLRVDWGRMERDNTIWRFTRQKKMVKVVAAKATANAAAALDGQQNSESPGENVPEFVTVPIYEGPIHSMQNEKLPVLKATADMNIGVTVEDKNIRYKEGDRVQVFEDVQLPQQLNWHPPGF